MLYFSGGRAAVVQYGRPPGHGYIMMRGDVPLITTTREAARWLRAYRDQRKEAGC